MERALAINGVIVLFTGLVGGYAFSKAIQKKPEREVAWRVVHSGGSMAGIMLLALAASWKILDFKGYSPLFAMGIIISTHLFMVAMFAAAITGKRGLSSDSKGIEKGIYIVYGIASLISTVTMGGMLFYLWLD
jgi:hypothetical protein